jgi:hypothetical protein
LIAVALGLCAAFLLYFGFLAESPAVVAIGSTEVGVWTAAAVTGLPALVLFAFGLRLLRRERH